MSVRVVSRMLSCDTQYEGLFLMALRTSSMNHFDVPGVRAGSLSWSTVDKAGGVLSEEAVSLLARHDAIGEFLLGYFRCTDGSYPPAHTVLHRWPSLFWRQRLHGASPVLLRSHFCRRWLHRVQVWRCLGMSLRILVVLFSRRPFDLFRNKCALERSGGD